jgi:chemotaxis protein CheC
MSLLSGIQRDTLTEILTLGLGQAGESLNELLDTHISLQAPIIKFFTREEFDDDLMPQLTDKIGTSATSTVQQNFTGDTRGGASLIFHPDSARKLVAVLTGEEITSPEIDTLRSGTLMEVGNIVINGILGTISNQLQCNLDFHLPEYRDEQIAKMFQSNTPQLHDHVFTYAEAVFQVKDLKISGILLIVFNIEDLQHFLPLLDQYYAREIQNNA